MQKKLIAIAVAAALAPAVAMADTSNVSVYGVAHLSVDSVSGNATQVALKRTAVNSNSSRLGVKGSEDLGSGLKAVFQFESGVNATGGAGVTDGNGLTTTGTLFTGSRDAFAGLSGDFGTLTFGRQALANQWVYDSNYFADQLGNAAIFADARQGGRANGMIIYKTNAMSGFTGSVSYIPGSSLSSASPLLSTATSTPVTGCVVTSIVTGTGDIDTVSNTVSGCNISGPVTGAAVGTSGKNSYGAKLAYAANGISANFTYFNLSTKNMGTNVETTNKPMTASVGYDFGNGTVSGQYVRDKSEVGATSTTQNIYNLGGKFKLGNGAIKAQYSHATDTTSAAANGANMYAIGYDYSLSKRTTAYASYAKTSNHNGGTFDVDSYGHGIANGRIAAPAGVTQDPNGFGFGLVHTF